MEQNSPTDERLRAVERALTDSDRSLDSIPETAALADRVDDLGDRLDELESRIDELDAALRAVRGYVGNVRHVNREVERTAEAALAKARSLDEAGGPAPLRRDSDPAHGRHESGHSDPEKPTASDTGADVVTGAEADCGVASEADAPTDGDACEADRGETATGGADAFDRIRGLL